MLSVAGMTLSAQLEARLDAAFDEAIRLTTPPVDGGEVPDRRETIINENLTAITDALRLLAREIDGLKQREAATW